MISLIIISESVVVYVERWTKTFVLGRTKMMDINRKQCTAGEAPEIDLRQWDMSTYVDKRLLVYTLKSYNVHAAFISEFRTLELEIFFSHVHKTL